MSLSQLKVGDARFRIGAWQGSAEVAYLAPLTLAPTLEPEVLSAVRRRLASDGYRSVVTSALLPRERDRLAADGFSQGVELLALRKELAEAPRLAPTARGAIRRARQSDIVDVLRVDAAAFAPFWRLDATGLEEARTATRAVRWMVARGRQIGAYSIAGRSGERGYLQRLAVDPPRQGRGLGKLLVTDALAWLRRGGAHDALVNTPPHNRAALALYEGCGFALEPYRLAVMRRELR